MTRLPRRCMYLASEYLLRFRVPDCLALERGEQDANG